MKNGIEVRKRLVASLSNIALVLSIFVVLFPLTLQTVSAEGNTIYVGSGPGNNTTSIKTAVEDLAVPGDTVKVWSGVYNETFTIDKTITLESIEGRDVTTIDARGTGTVITISAPWVNVTGFTIMNGEAG